MTEVPAAGWYADPSGAQRMRYWDGAAWTDRVMERVSDMLERWDDDAAATRGEGHGLSDRDWEDLRHGLFVVLALAELVKHGRVTTDDVQLFCEVIESALRTEDAQGSAVCRALLGEFPDQYLAIASRYDGAHRSVVEVLQAVAAVLDRVDVYDAYVYRTTLMLLAHRMFQTAVDAVSRGNRAQASRQAQRFVTDLHGYLHYNPNAPPPAR